MLRAQCRAIGLNEVAEALCISIDTVKHHLTHALVATACTNRTQLALAWQREMGPAAAPVAPGTGAA